MCGYDIQSRLDYLSDWDVYTAEDDAHTLTDDEFENELEDGFEVYDSFMDYAFCELLTNKYWELTNQKLIEELAENMSGDPL